MRRLALLLLLAPCACHESMAPRIDPARCQHTGEFDNYGCAVVMGLVTDSTGRPLDGAYMKIADPVDSARRVELAGGYTRTDATGHYQARVLRMLSLEPPSIPDTLSVRVVASVPPPTAQVGVPGPGNSTIVVLHWQPIGAIPDTAYVPTIAVPTSR